MTTASRISSFDDPIVDEIRKVRAQLARDADYDLHAICERLREAEREDPKRVGSPKLSASSLADNIAEDRPR